MMQKTVHIRNKPVEVTLSAAAEKQLQATQTEILAELELYFSCQIRKKVRFHAARTNDDSIPVCPGLRLGFRPVMTAHCGKDFEGDEPPVTDFPIHNPDAFIPHWVRIDFIQGQWAGEFGFHGKGP